MKDRKLFSSISHIQCLEKFVRLKLDIVSESLDMPRLGQETKQFRYWAFREQETITQKLMFFLDHQSALKVTVSGIVIDSESQLERSLAEVGLRLSKFRPKIRHWTFSNVAGTLRVFYIWKGQGNLVLLCTWVFAGRQDSLKRSPWGRGRGKWEGERERENKKLEFRK